MLIRIFLLLMSIYSQQAQALDFFKLDGTFGMSGKIENGDFKNFLDALSKWNYPPTIFFIESSGGSVSEAMKIGSFIRESFIPIWTGKKCYSSCFLIYASGISKKAGGDIGIHRVYFAPEEYSKLSVSEARIKYAKLKAATKQYLVQIDTPQSIIEKMFSTGSADIYIFSADKANSIFGLKAPFYDEWLNARCGSLSTSDKEIFESIGYLSAYIASKEIFNDKTIPKAPEFEKSIKENFDKSQIALSIKTNNPKAFKKYKQLATERYLCIKKSEDNQIWKSFFKFKSQYKLEGAISE